MEERFGYNCGIGTFLLLAVLIGVPWSAWGQTTFHPGNISFSAPGESNSMSAPTTITFSDALKRAKANSPQFQAALTALGVAHQGLVQSRAGVLPSVNYNMEYLYTKGIPGTNSPIFIANNAVNEYIAQGNVHENLSLQTFADYGRANAAQALAQAKAEVAARGLVVTVTQAYYGYLAAQRKYATSQHAMEEAERFMGLSQKLEKGGEVAHSDTVKAEIQHQQQQRDLRESELAMNKARLELAVLLFPDFNQNFTIVDDLGPPQPLPGFDEVNAAGMRNNPDLRAAEAALRQAGKEVSAAWGGVLPSFTLDYWYGIDATHFATKNDGVNNLGSAAAATMQLPLWNWGANASKIKQANLLKKQAAVELSAAQRTLLADLHSFYEEAQAARIELESLTQSAQLAAESLRLVNLRYQAGESTVLEVVDAQNTANQAAKAYDDGQLRFRVAVANLQTLTGNF
jgi:outer membrane protein TolC